MDVFILTLGALIFAMGIGSPVNGFGASLVFGGILIMCIALAMHLMAVAS